MNIYPDIISNRGWHKIYRQQDMNKSNQVQILDEGIRFTLH